MIRPGDEENAIIFLPTSAEVGFLVEAQRLLVYRVEAPWPEKKFQELIDATPAVSGAVQQKAEFAF